MPKPPERVLEVPLAVLHAEPTVSITSESREVEMAREPKSGKQVEPAESAAPSSMVSQSSAAPLPIGLPLMVPVKISQTQVPLGQNEL